MQAKLIKVGWILMLVLGIFRIIVALLLAKLPVAIPLATTGAAIIGITLGSYRKAEKWSWWCLLVVGVAPLVSSTLAHGMQWATLTGWVLFILALAIPAKAILGKKSA